MSTDDIQKSIRYIENLDISAIAARRHLEEVPPRFRPVTDQDQAVVIGPQVQTFVKGVDESERRMIANAMLLAQLAAAKHVDNKDWFDTYFEALSNTGFVSTDLTTATTSRSAEQGDVDKSLLEIVASLVGGPASSAYLVVEVALKALENLGSDDATFRVFKDQKYEDKQRFAFSVVEPDSSQARVSLLTLAFETFVHVEQILFSHTRVYSAEVSVSKAGFVVNREVMEDLAPAVAEKVKRHTSDFIRQLDINL